MVFFTIFSHYHLPALPHCVFASLKVSLSDRGLFPKHLNCIFYQQMCFVTLPPRSNGHVKIPCSCLNSVYLIVRGVIDSVRRAPRSGASRFHQQTSSPRQTERAGVSTTRRSILIQIGLAVNSRCLGRTGRCAQTQIGLSCLPVCVYVGASTFTWLRTHKHTRISR